MCVRACVQCARLCASRLVSCAQRCCKRIVCACACATLSPSRTAKVFGSANASPTSQGWMVYGLFVGVSGQSFLHALSGAPLLLLSSSIVWVCRCLCVCVCAESVVRCSSRCARKVPAPRASHTMTSFVMGFYFACACESVCVDI